tara:strand:- start:81 stop:323 length:243 start_codon:yes stop_codon:yes gene_type:complete
MDIPRVLDLKADNDAAESKKKESAKKKKNFEKGSIAALQASIGLKDGDTAMDGDGEARDDGANDDEEERKKALQVSLEEL